MLLGGLGPTRWGTCCYGVACFDARWWEVDCLILCERTSMISGLGEAVYLLAAVCSLFVGAG